MQRNEVRSTLNDVRDELDQGIKQLNEIGAEFFKAGNYETAHCIGSMATRLCACCQKVKTLANEREDRFPEESTEVVVKGVVPVRTPEEWNRCALRRSFSGSRFSNCWWNSAAG